jgi:hypothetical protein
VSHAVKEGRRRKERRKDRWQKDARRRRKVGKNGSEMKEGRKQDKWMEEGQLETRKEIKAGRRRQGATDRECRRMDGG